MSAPATAIAASGTSNTLTIKVGGTTYGNFKEASATKWLDIVSNEFSFLATSEDAQPLPFKLDQPCKIYADGELVVTGFIEVIEVSADPRSHEILIAGRDKTSDLVDSTIDGLSSITGDVSLKALCEIVIAHIGSDLEVIDNAKPAVFEAAQYISNPDPGTNAIEFLEHHARERQVLLTSDAQGRLVIDKPVGVLVDGVARFRVRGFVQNQVGDPDGANNVLRSKVSYDSTGRFRNYRVISQANIVALALAGTTEASSIANQSSSVFVDDEVRAGRQMVVMSETLSSSASALQRAMWTARVRKSRSKVYGATVSGYRNRTGNLWDINEIVSVNDDAADVHASMLANSVTYAVSPDDGPTVTMALLVKNAYSLTLEDPAAGDIGGNTVG